MDWLSLALAALAVSWLVFAAGRLRDLRDVVQLPDATGAAARPPRVSLIVPARDEAGGIEATVRALAAQRGVELEIVVVDDRSTDGTGDVLRRLAGEIPSLRTVRVERLPEGWLGKPHACSVGAAAAGGEWLVFADADALMGPDLLARAVAAARDSGAAHVALFPGETDATFGGRAAMLHFSLGLVLAAGRVNRDAPGAFVGIGAFNLVRADAYRAAGGHERLRYEIVDDMKLGLEMRRSGFRSRAWAATGDLRVRWAATARGMVAALEKNFFAVFDYRVGTTVAFVALVIVPTAVTLATPLALATGRAAGLLPPLGLLSLALPCARLSRRAGWGVGPALAAPFMGPLLALAVARSMVRTLRAGGVRWRGTFYPLDELRRRGRPFGTGIIPGWRAS